MMDDPISCFHASFDEPVARKAHLTSDDSFESHHASPAAFFISEDEESASEDLVKADTAMSVGDISKIDLLEGEGTEEPFPVDLMDPLEPTPIGPNCVFLGSSSLDNTKIEADEVESLDNSTKSTSFPKSVSTDSLGSGKKKRKLSDASPETVGEETKSPSVSGDSKRSRFRLYQEDQWIMRFRELVEFRREHGHCLVPHYYKPNQPLAQWVKRQRYQYKLKHSLNKHSTLTDDREEELENLGFVWNYHSAGWYERFEALKAFKQKFGHTSVPGNQDEYKSLAIWVKCQRRQFKKLSRGKQSSLSEDRVEALDKLGFIWNPRNV